VRQEVLTLRRNPRVEDGLVNLLIERVVVQVIAQVKQRTELAGEAVAISFSEVPLQLVASQSQVVGLHIRNVAVFSDGTDLLERFLSARLQLRPLSFMLVVFIIVNLN